MLGLCVLNLRNHCRYIHPHPYLRNLALDGEVIPVKVRELKEYLALLKDRDDDLEVVIPIKVDYVYLTCSKPVACVASVNRGIDWDARYFFINPAIDLMEKKK